MLADSLASSVNARATGDTGVGPVTETICGAYELAPTGIHPLQRDLPEIARLDTRGRPELKAAVDLLGSEVARPGLGTTGVIPALLDTFLHYALRAWLEADATGWAAALATRPSPTRR